MKRFSSRVAAVFFALVGAPGVALAAVAFPTTFQGLAVFAVGIISSLTAAAIGLGVVYFLWGVAGPIGESESAKSWEKFRDQIGWGILTLFIMFSIWGILRLLGNTLFGNNNFR